MKKIALITGVTGQDGSYLTEILLKKGYIVHGLIRKSSSFNTNRIDHIIKDKKYIDLFFFHYGDLTDPSSLNRLLDKIKPQKSITWGSKVMLKYLFRYQTTTRSRCYRNFKNVRCN